MRPGSPDLRTFVDACRRAGELQEVFGAAPDIEVVRRGWASPIDPPADLMGEGRAYNSRVVIDACMPFTKKNVFPAVAASDPEALARLAQKWRHVLGGDGRS